MSNKPKQLPAPQTAITPAKQAGVINPVSAGLNVALSANQRFVAKGAPLSTFENNVVDDLERDIFWSLYLWDIRFGETPPYDREANRSLLEWLLLDPQFDAMRGTYTNRMIGAAVTAYEVTQNILDNIPKVGNAMGELGEADDLEQQADDLDNQADQQEQQEQQENDNPDGDNPDGDNEETDGTEGQDRESYSDDQDRDDYQPDPDWDDEQDNQGGDGDDDEVSGGDDEQEQGGGQPSPDDLRDQADQKRQEADAKRQQAEQQIKDALGGDYAGAMRSNAVQEGKDTGDEVSMFLSYWGFEEGQGLELSIAEIRRFIELLGNREINQLTVIMGRVHSIAREVLRGRADVDVYVDSYGLTTDIFDMSVDQQALLSTAMPEELRGYYIRKFFEDGGLPGYTRTAEASKEGAFIGAVDESISMDSPLFHDGNDNPVMKNIVAKALALGLARAAKENGQDFQLIGFSSGNPGLHGVEQVTSDGRKAIYPVTPRTALGDMLAWGTWGINGGTDFDMALKFMMDVFDKLDDEDKRGADLLIVTDGQAGVEEKTRQRFEYLKQDWGVRLHLLLIGGAPMDDIVEIADSIIDFNNLDDVAGQIASKMWD